MKSQLIRLVVLMVMFCGISDAAFAQKKKVPVAKRTSAKRTTKTTTNAKVQAAKPSVDTVAAVAIAPAPRVMDSLPIKKIAKSLRRDGAVDDDAIRDRTPLAYEHLRADDAVYRHKIWREIDTREKINLPFRYSADEDNGNQRFISILLQAIQDSAVTVFDAIDDRFTTPLTKAQVAEKILGPEIEVPMFNEAGEPLPPVKKRNEINLDSIYKFRIKEEVVFDKESSRLFWRILGIAPVQRIITPQGLDLGETDVFWVYYPDMRPVFAKYEVYNGKNFGARMSWEELFESRYFASTIVKSTIDNPYDLYIDRYIKDPILRLMESDNIKSKIFNFEQDLWSF